MSKYAGEWRKLDSVRTILVACAAALFVSEANFAQIREDQQGIQSTINERMIARRAAAAKALADQMEVQRGASNLQLFYKNLQSYKSKPIVNQPTIPEHKLDSGYLESLSHALTSRPYIWLDDHPLGRGEYRAAVALLGYRVVGSTNSVTGTCSGTLIARYAVLTAAHCVCELGEKIWVFLDTENYRKSAGTRVAVTAIKSRIENCTQYLAADLEGKRNILHSTGDVAVLFLDQKASHLDITPAVIVNDFKPNDSYYIVGYGISDDDPSPGVRRLATIQGMPCSRPAADKYGCNTTFEFWGDGRQITGRTDRPDSCGGDSGGSVFSTDKGAPPRLIGVISRPIKGTTCGQGGVYVLMTPPIIGWVEEQRKLGAGQFPPA